MVLNVVTYGVILFFCVSVYVERSKSCLLKELIVILLSVIKGSEILLFQKESF